MHTRPTSAFVHPLSLSPSLFAFSICSIYYRNYHYRTAQASSHGKLPYSPLPRHPASCDVGIFFFHHRNRMTPVQSNPIQSNPVASIFGVLSEAEEAAASRSLELVHFLLENFHSASWDVRSRQVGAWQASRQECRGFRQAGCRGLAWFVGLGLVIPVCVCVCVCKRFVVRCMRVSSAAGVAGVAM